MATTKKTRAVKQNEEGLGYYADWHLDEARNAFEKAIAADPENPEYHLNLARTHARANQFDQAMETLGDYLHVESDEGLAARFERLFSTALDDVESTLIAQMRALGFPLEQIGKGIQMWLEYRITHGRQPLRVGRAALWAAALAHGVARVNLSPIGLAAIAESFDVSERSLKKKYEEVAGALDLMPADYRYFTGDENPLDKLVEAAEELDALYDQFQAE